MKKIAIVYDWVDKWGGAERILLVLSQMFPQAVFYTSVTDFDEAVWAKKLPIKTSFIQKLPAFIRKKRLFSLFFYSYAFESFNFNHFDLVISVTSSFAKEIITRPETKHVCYLLTPTRFLWPMTKTYLSSGIRFFMAPFIYSLRKTDFISSQRPDKIISISKTVSNRCAKYYRRDSSVIYPPFDFNYWKRVEQKMERPSFKKKNFFLIVSRLEMYKKVSLAIRAFNQLKDKQLVVVGKGSEENRLRKLAGENITFLRYVKDEELAFLYSRARALIVPQEEDFGYIFLESLFFNCPVLAFSAGGAKEVVIDGKTGLFFSQQTVTSLVAAIEKISLLSYNLRRKIKLVKLNILDQFSLDNFKRNFLKQINKL